MKRFLVALVAGILSAFARCDPPAPLFLAPRTFFCNSGGFFLLEGSDAPELGGPGRVTFDGDGYLYINEWGNNVIRKVGAILSNDGIHHKSTVAGNGTQGYSGDSGPSAPKVTKLKQVNLRKAAASFRS